MVVLIVNSTETACGVYQFGLSLFRILGSASGKNDYKTACCASAKDVVNAVDSVNPRVIVFNYHPATQPFVDEPFLKSLKRPCLGIYHEITPEVARTLDDHPFDHWICSDPTAKTTQHLSKIGRPILPYDHESPLPEVATIGTFGFGFSSKGFARVVDIVQSQFDKAIIKAHIPSSRYGDQGGTAARERIVEMRRAISKPNIYVMASHNLMSTDDLLGFLAGNTVNVFFYDYLDGRGISSATDYALAVGRPIAITKSFMFRHMWEASPSILIEETSLPAIIRNSVAPLLPFKEAWSPANVAADFDRIMAKFG